MNPRADSGTLSVTPRTALTDITPTLDTARASTHEVTSLTSDSKAVQSQLAFDAIDSSTTTDTATLPAALLPPVRRLTLPGLACLVREKRESCPRIMIFTGIHLTARLSRKVSPSPRRNEMEKREGKMQRRRHLNLGMRALGRSEGICLYNGRTIRQRYWYIHTLRLRSCFWRGVTSEVSGYG